MAKDCWYELFEDDLEPDNGFFKEFKKSWPSLNTVGDTPSKILVCNSRNLVKLSIIITFLLAKIAMMFCPGMITAG